MTDGLEEKGASYVPQINEAYEAMVKAEESTLNARIKLGELLNDASEAVGHGNFGPWLEKHCKVSHSSANVFMKLAANKKKLDPAANSQRATILAAGREMSVRQALKEIRSPKEKKEAEEKAAKAKERKKAKEAAEIAAVKAETLYDLLSDGAPEEVFDVLTVAWDEEKLAELTSMLVKHSEEEPEEEEEQPAPAAPPVAVEERRV